MIKPSVGPFRNIGACKEFAETVQTCYGPNGMNKMVINHLEKLFVTNDAATIIRSIMDSDGIEANANS